MAPTPEEFQQAREESEDIRGIVAGSNNDARREFAPPATLREAVDLRRFGIEGDLQALLPNPGAQPSAEQQKEVQRLQDKLAYLKSVDRAITLFEHAQSQAPNGLTFRQFMDDYQPGTYQAETDDNAMIEGAQWLGSDYFNDVTDVLVQERMRARHKGS